MYFLGPLGLKGTCHNAIYMDDSRCTFWVLWAQKESFIWGMVAEPGLAPWHGSKISQKTSAWNFAHGFWAPFPKREQTVSNREQTVSNREQPWANREQPWADPRKDPKGTSYGLKKNVKDSKGTSETVSKPWANHEQPWANREQPWANREQAWAANSWMSRPEIENNKVQAPSLEKNIGELPLSGHGMWYVRSNKYIRYINHRP